MYIIIRITKKGTALKKMIPLFDRKYDRKTPKNDRSFGRLLVVFLVTLEKLQGVH